MTLFPKSQHVVVVGAGYAGLPCAFRLAQKIQKESLQNKIRVTLINPEPKQELTCELFRVLRTGVPEFFSFTKLAKKLDIRFIEGSVSEINPKKQEIFVRGQDKSSLMYDHLVLALGNKAKVPEITGLKDMLAQSEQGQSRVFLFKNNAQAQALRLALKRLNWSSPNATADKDLFVVVLGAGTTGLEVAAEIACLRGKNKKARVILLDEKASLLDEFSPIAKRVLKKELGRLNIESILGSPAMRVSETEIFVKNGQVIPWHLLVVCAGSRPPNKVMDPFQTANGPMGLRVDSQLQMEHFPQHYSIGDLATASTDTMNASEKTYIPKTAQIAVQEGYFLADSLVEKIVNGTSKASFNPVELGYLVSLGPMSGFARIGPQAQHSFLKFASPFLVGPMVDQLKRAAKIKYTGQLQLAAFNKYI